MIETTEDGGRKILISGGGRCNILPETLAPGRFVTDSPASLVRRYALLVAAPGTARVLRARRRHSAQVRTRSRQVVSRVGPRASTSANGLVDLARRQGVVVPVQDRARRRRAVRCRASSSGRSRGELDASAVVLATGGLSVPATGSTGTGLTVARAFGHVVHDTYPALTPLVASPADSRDTSAGVSTEREDARAPPPAASPPSWRATGPSTLNRTAAFSSRIAATADRPCSTYRTWPFEASRPRESRGGAARAVVRPR